MEKKSIKKIIEDINIFSIWRKKKMREKLENSDISFLCPNCMGGILFHDLGLKFCSPTVNLMLRQTDFIQFILHLEEYLQGEFTFFKEEELTCPCAFLHAKGLPDIRITFTHYVSEDEAKQKWKERCSRIRTDNLFVFLQERDGLTKEDIEQLSALKVKGIVVFTAHEYKDIPYTVYIKKYEAVGEVGNIMKRNYLNGSREYEKYFDFVKWFNEADGVNFDVSPYIKTH